MQFFQELFQTCQHHFPVLLGMSTLFFGCIIVLSQRDMGLIPLGRQFDGYRVIILRSIRDSRKRAEMTVLNGVPWLEPQNRAFVLVGFALPFPFPDNRLPSCQSETTWVPNMYCWMASGFTSASQTCSLGALMFMEALAISFLSITQLP